jgi:hypothetical protein
MDDVLSMIAIGSDEFHYRFGAKLIKGSFVRSVFGLLGPIAIIHALVVKAETATAQAKAYESALDSKKYPYCAEIIKKAGHGL